VDVRDLTGATALVTGAGSGIGREIARACARRGARVAICELDEARLGEAERGLRELGADVLARRVDVGSRTEMEGFAADVHRDWGPVDLLVNNAGVGLGGMFLETTLDDWEWIAQTNFFGVVHGCHFFVPEMAKRGRPGHVVNIASAAAYAPLPAQSAYAATKSAVLGLSVAMHTELRHEGIGVTAVCPGFIDTPIVERSRLRGVAADPETRQRTAAFYRRRGYGPERVARKTLRAVQRNRVVAPISLEAFGLYYASRVAPGLLRWVNGQLARRVSSGRTDVPEHGSSADLTTEERDRTMTNEEIIRDFIAAWSRLDPEELASYFCEDGAYHNMPTGPVKGRKNVEEMIRGFISSWTETEWEILHLLARGDVVIAERVDRTKAGDKGVDLPCTGVFEMEGGKIKVWRDYFDLGTYVRAMG
jgi:NAD(P)-dependent dehydrogenase (short-subunit alcohol dehydrogenase family)